MDFLTFRSGRRQRNQSKRFPTRELEQENGTSAQIPSPAPKQLQSPPALKEQKSPAGAKSKGSKKIKRPPIQPEKIIKQITEFSGEGIASPSPKELQSKEELESPVSVRQASEAASPENNKEGRFSREPIISEISKHSMEDHTGSSSGGDFDLKPPTSKPKESLETLSLLLHSEDYLKVLTSDTRLLARFTTFLSRYKSDIAHLITQHLETEKVIKAVSYANAIASALVKNNLPKIDTISPVVEISSSFSEASKHAFYTLLEIALPAWVTYSLIKSATSCLTAEITGQSTALTYDLIGGLSEAFTISDPKLPDNPLVYASDEFYRLTGYSRDNVLGHNCRFLQGPKTKRESTQRLKKAIDAGEEICETLLNYRRDGTPFVNVLLLAPLHDSKGNVKYYLGAQVDASRLVEGGRGVNGFERYLVGRVMDSEKAVASSDPKENVLAKLRDLGKTFDLEESAVIQENSQRGSMNQDRGSRSLERDSQGRRVIQEDDDGSNSDEDSQDGEGVKDEKTWTLSQDIDSGQLPGIYQKYVLIRAYPSLRMIFVSQEARKLGKLQQRPFLSHVAAPSATLSGLKESFQSGTPVAAKVAIMKLAGDGRNGTKSGAWGKRLKKQGGEGNPSKMGKTCWISATPLKDGNGKIGVWMVVIVDEGTIATNLERSSSLSSRIRGEGKQDLDAKKGVGLSPTTKSIQLDPTSLPIKPIRLDSSVGTSEPSQVKMSTGNPQTPSLNDGMVGVASQNGATTPSHSSTTPHRDSPEQEEPQTRVRTNFGSFVETTPRTSISQGSQSRRDVGLRAMDAKLDSMSQQINYLTSRSSVQQNQTNSQDGVVVKRGILMTLPIV
jgi:PAS domain S-box-containing protein